MRILFLVHRVPYPPNKGDKIRALWELKSLAANHEIDLFCFYDHEEDRESIEALRPYCRDCYAEPLSWFRSRLRALGAALRGRSFSTAYFYSSTMMQRLKRAVASRKYDAVLAFSSSMAQYAELAIGVPKILDMVDVDSAKWASYAETASFLTSWVWRQEARLLGDYERQIAETFSRTLLCTEAEAALLKQRCTPGASVSVLRHMIDTNYFDPRKVEVPAEIARLAPYVVFVGSMDYAPNIDAVAWFHKLALPLMQARIPEIKFAIVGRNPAKAVLELSKDPAVVVTGSVPDVRPYLLGASAGVAPMLLARGVQNKILESMAMGLPIAASSKAAVAFPIELLSLIIVEDDPGRLAAKLLDAIQNGPQPPVAQLRESLEKVFGDNNLKHKLDEFLRQAVGASRTETIEAQPTTLGAAQASARMAV